MTAAVAVERGLRRGRWPPNVSTQPDTIRTPFAHVLNWLALSVAHVERTSGREREQWLTDLGAVVTKLHDAPQAARDGRRDCRVWRSRAASASPMRTRRRDERDRRLQFFHAIGESKGD